MARQSFNAGTAPSGIGGDTNKTINTKWEANFTELYKAMGAVFGGVNSGAPGAVLPTALPIANGGTGATTQTAAAKALLPAATTGQFLKYDGTNWIASADNNTTYSNMSTAEITAGTATIGRLITPKDLKTAVGTYKSATTTKFATARKIKLAKGASGEVYFDGSGDANIDVTLNSLGDITVFKDTDTARTEYLELKTDGTNGSSVFTKASGSGSVRPLALGAGTRTHMQLDPTGNLKINPLGIDALSTEITGNFGHGGKHNLALKALGTGLYQAVGVSFYPTFATGTDYLPRRAASIGAGYANGTWGTEFLDIHVGGSNDSQDVPKRRVSIAANGVIELGDGGTAPCRLRVIGDNPGINWSERDVLVENRTQDSAAIAFHAPKHSSAGILKWYGRLSQFEFRDSVDTTHRPVVASAFNQSSDYRLKTITGNVVSSGAFIDALKPRVGTWKEDGSAFVGFVAHEVQEVSPSSVTGVKDGVDDNGKEVYQGVAYSSSEIVANIVAELQSLRKRVAELELKTN